MDKGFSGSSADLEKYVEAVFQPEDEVLHEIRVRSEAAGLPNIHVGKMDGLHLEVLALAVGARKIVEIGTLAGFSGVCLARALPAGGRLYTFEYERKHAEVAMESFKKAGLSDKVEVFVGAAIDNLKKIEKDGPFDIVFIDADKPAYPAYLEWSITNLRKGGMILADNTFAMGEIANSSKTGERTIALRAYNKSCANDPRLRSTILPTSDGLTVSIVL